jgi:hypothetical protein
MLRNARTNPKIPSIVTSLDCLYLITTTNPKTTLNIKPTYNKGKNTKSFNASTKKNKEIKIKE